MSFADLKMLIYRKIGKKMNDNKTCGECRYHKKNRCMLPCYTINHSAENSACHHFEVKTPTTHGDRIRQKNNAPDTEKEKKSNE